MPSLMATDICASGYITFLVAEKDDSSCSLESPIAIYKAYGMKAHDMPC